MRKILLLGALLGATASPAAPASAATTGQCALDGVATISPGLVAGAPVSFSYTFHGKLSDCLVVFSGLEYGPGENISAGEPLTIDGIDYEWPSELRKPTGQGSCLTSATSGTALLYSADGVYASVVDFDTRGAAAGIGLTGTYGDRSIVLQSVARTSTGQPAHTRLLNANRWAGADAAGLLAFQPEDPALCASTGVTRSPISGRIGHVDQTAPRKRSKRRTSRAAHRQTRRR